MTYFDASRMAPGYGHDPVPSITGSSLRRLGQGGGVTYIGAVHIAAIGVKILDRPKLSLDLLTTPDLCP